MKRCVKPVVEACGENRGAGPRPDKVDMLRHVGLRPASRIWKCRTPSYGWISFRTGSNTQRGYHPSAARRVCWWPNDVLVQCAPIILARVPPTRGWRRLGPASSRKHGSSDPVYSHNLRDQAAARIVPNSRVDELAAVAGSAEACRPQRPRFLDGYGYLARE